MEFNGVEFRFGVNILIEIFHVLDDVGMFYFGKISVFEVSLV